MSSGSGLRLEADFFRKTNNLSIARERKIHTIQMRTAHLAVALSLLVGLAFGSFRLARFLVSWDRLSVRTFRLHNPPRYQAARAQRILRAHRGNILTLDLSALHDALRAIPEVRNVSLSRILPDTVSASFELSQPEFAWENGGRWQVLDAAGVTLHETAAAEPGLIPVRRTAAGDLPRLLARLGELQPLRSRIEHVAWEEPYGLALKLAGTGETFYPGESDYRSKIETYLQLKRRLHLDGQEIRYADLRMNDRIYFEPLVPEDLSHEK